MIRAMFGAAKWLLREAVMPAAEKAIPQGSAELAQALLTQGNAYVPYGPTERPLEGPDTPTITGRQIKEREID